MRTLVDPVCGLMDFELGEGRWIGRHAPEGMDGEAMISDTREGAGARADESTLVVLYNWCWYATRARDGTTADT